MQLPIKRFQLAGIVARHLRVDVSDVAIRGYKAEVLVLHVAQASGQQSGGTKQDHGESRLHHYQRFLPPSAMIRRGAIRTPQGIHRI